MEKLYIWVTPQGTYYHKVCKGYYKYNKCGDVNQYKHKLVHIIDLNDFISYSPRKRNKRYVNYRKMLINDTIRFLEKLR